MARVKIEPLAETTIILMKNYYASLSEKDQRRFASVEAQRMGYGGIEYIAGVLGCSTRTINRGMKELEKLPVDPAAGRVRRPGAGRKKSSPPRVISNKT
jgi:hypothetical protein